MRAVILSILAIYSISYSATETVTQTDWSGGGGVPGPVTDWGNTYDSAGQINDTTGLLRLLDNQFSPVEHTLKKGNVNVCSVYAADVDGDGDTDILAAYKNLNTIVWWENAGQGSSWIERTIGDNFFGAFSVYATDIDGDGDTDVLGAALLGNDITWWENTMKGSSWTPHLIEPEFEKAISVYATDLDGDGDTDLLGAAFEDQTIAWWENLDTGAGIYWKEHTVDNDFYAVYSVYSADVDGDGDMDVVGGSMYEYYVTWWENTGGLGILWREHKVGGIHNGAVSVYAADVDGDGDIDILGAINQFDDLLWFENVDGKGLFWADHMIDADFAGAASVYATDIDGDGDTDVVGAGWNEGEIILWKNTDGTGTVWTKELLMSGMFGACTVYSTDIDGDGDTDVLAGAYLGDHKVVWWNVAGYYPEGTLESSILDVGDVGSWETFTSSEREPSGTSVSYQFRSSDDPSSMGVWSDTIFNSSVLLPGILADSTNYLQYRVILQTTDSTSSPTLDNVAFSYTTFVGIDEPDGTEVAGWGLTSEANPSFGSCELQVSLPQQAVVDLQLFDVTGRVAAVYSQELPGGTHSVVFSNVAQGVYFCTMHAGDFTATERIVVL